MARSYGKVLAASITDDDLNDLSGDEAALYFRLLGHPKLSLVGLLDYRPQHWCQLQRNWTREYVERLVVELEVRRFVAVDRGTEEFMYRTLTKHDGIPMGNAKLRKGLWGAWQSVASKALRQVAIVNMPEAVFSFGDAPEAAVKMRESLRRDSLSDSVPDYLMPRVTDRAIGSGSDSLSSIHLPLDTTSAPESVGRSTSAVDN